LALSVRHKQNDGGKSYVDVPVFISRRVGDGRYATGILGGFTPWEGWKGSLVIYVGTSDRQLSANKRSFGFACGGPFQLAVQGRGGMRLNSCLAHVHDRCEDEFTWVQGDLLCGTLLPVKGTNVIIRLKLFVMMERRQRRGKSGSGDQKRRPTRRASSRSLEMGCWVKRGITGCWYESGVRQQIGCGGCSADSGFACCCTTGAWLSCAGG